MKKIFFAIAAIAAVCACQKNEMPVDSQAAGETVTITAGATVGDQTKVTMGDKSGEIYPVSWNESGERVFLREVARDTDPAKTTTVDTGSVSFSKIDAHKARLVFKLAALKKEVTYDYAAVYPCHPDGVKKSLDHGVRQGGTDAKNRVSYILNHEKSQVPLEDRPDPATHIMMATDLNHSSQATSLDLNFKYVVAFGKMTLKNFPALAAGETVSKITVTAPSTKIMTGRLFHYFRATASCAVDSTVAYSATTVKPYVMIDPQNITFNTTGFDVWFTTFPFDMVKDDILSLSVQTSVKTYTANIKLSSALKFEAGKVSEFIYDYQKGQPKAETKTLTFDFTGAAQTGWPTADKWKTVETAPVPDSTVIYKLNDVNYSFVLSACRAATQARVAWTSTGITIYAAQRFLGLPALSGWKLIGVKCTQGTAPRNSRKAGITDKVTASTSEEYSYVTGGGSTVWDVDTITYSLSGTQANTVYYLACTAGGVGSSKIELTYEKVDQ